MKHNTFKKTCTCFLISLLVLPMLSAASKPIAPQPANGSGRQIIFIVDGAELTLTDVRISGTNQEGVRKTWEKHDSNGFKLAYTKNWWWVEDFVQIDFSYRYGSSQQSISGTCLIDVLEYPPDSPRVEIVYFKDQGCAGGESGSSRDPIADPFKLRAKQVGEAFKTAEFYLSDFDEEVFIETFIYMEINATACVVGVGTALQSGGLSYGLAAASVTSACERSGRKILQTFFAEP
jgi:hypothetical protein